MLNRKTQYFGSRLLFAHQETRADIISSFGVAKYAAVNPSKH